MELIRPFSKLGKNDVAIAGGKGASLGEMTQAGIPVPPGYVILSQAFERFIEETNINVEIDTILHKVKHDEIHTIEDASEQIKAIILNAKIPQEIATKIKDDFKKLGSKYVAVRSSATAEDSSSAAWAGQLESYLNTTESMLLENVKKCWASLFTPRAIFYRFEKDLHKTKISVAVIVQKMVESEVSGIAFSVHPITQDYNQLIIEAGYGLGEAIVSGQITPDSYIIEKEPRHIFVDRQVSKQEKGLYKVQAGGNEWRNIQAREGSRQKLSDKQILKLTEIILRIENHYKFPCDVEWAYEKGQFYIVQSRPITTLTNKPNQSQLPKIDRHNYNPEDYLRMFSANNFAFIFSDIFLQYYNSLGVLSLQSDKYWISFFPKSSKIKTMEEGAKLYTNKKIFDEYNKDFHKYIKESSKYFKSILKKDKIKASEIKKFLDLAAKHFSYYSKTEFFYTDGVNHKKMVISVAEFDKLKLDGREYLNKILFLSNGYLRTLLKKISNQTKVPESELLFYGTKEFIDLVENGKRVDPQEIKERHLFFHSQDHTYFGENSKEIVEKFFSNYMKMAEIIRGTTANKGKVTGKARILALGLNEFDKVYETVAKMQKGEILIAETTAPEIIGACKKAAAIVTNQGGMLSHAAIISRELNIPCIIGTDKNVLLNIKTGDEIEVDANIGVVKVIKKAK